MKTEYNIIKKLNSGLVLISSIEYGEQIWHKAKCRKHMTCWITGESLYKKEAYRPETNGYNRMHRIKAEIIEKAAEVFLTPDNNKNQNPHHMKSQKEKDEAMKALEEEKKNLRETTYFGDNNHEAIDFAIRVIEEDLDEDDIYDEMEDGEDDHVRSWGLQAAQWLNGEIGLNELLGRE